MVTSIFLRYKNRNSISVIYKRGGKQIKSETFKDLKYFKSPSNRDERSINAKSVKEAKRRLNKLKNQNDDVGINLDDLQLRNHSFIDWYKEVIEEKAIKSEKTAIIHRTSLKYFKKYLKEKRNLTDITRWNISPELLYDYKRFIELYPGISNGTKNNKLSNIKVVVREGIKRGKGFQKNALPEDLTIKFVNEKKAVLSPQECRMLFNTSTNGIFDNNRIDYQTRYNKEFFMFSCLTGMTHRDAKNFKWEHIDKKIDGKWTFNYKRFKTGKKYYDIPLSNQAIILLKEIRLMHDSDYVFPGLVYTHQELSRLKRWVKRAGIDKNITFHCARATFASIFIKIPGNDIQTLMKFMGHQDIDTTLRYLSSNLEQMSKQINNMLDLRAEPKASLIAV